MSAYDYISLAALVLFGVAVVTYQLKPNVSTVDYRDVFTSPRDHAQETVHAEAPEDEVPDPVPAAPVDEVVLVEKDFKHVETSRY